MAPSRRKTTPAGAAANNPTRRIMTRSIYKKQQQQKLIKIESLEQVSSMSLSSNKELCSTPKGDKYMIPKISTCPPAPKKKRLVLNCSSSSSTNPASSSAKFFAHSDLEVFFLFAPRDIHA